MLTGITIDLVTRSQTGSDPFGAPVYTETLEQVENVLVGEPTSQEKAETFDLTGRRVQYILGIPKTDTHNWEDVEVVLPAPFSGRYRSIGIPVSGVPELIPLTWNTKVMVERFG